MFLFYTPWKHRKTFGFLMFQGGVPWKIGKKWEKQPLEACNFIITDTLAQVFSCQFCEISKNTFFTFNFLELSKPWRNLAKHLSWDVLQREFSVNFCIQSKYGKIRARKNSVFGHFLRSVVRS